MPPGGDMQFASLVKGIPRLPFFVLLLGSFFFFFLPFSVSVSLIEIVMLSFLDCHEVSFAWKNGT